MAYFSTGSYILTVIVMFVLVFALWAILKDRSDKTKKTVLLVLAWVNFALHFLKILMPPYSDIFNLGIENNWPYSILNIGFDNLCSVNTLLLPFACLSKRSWFKDGVFLMAFLGGFGAVLYAHDFFYANINIANGIRYYICHYTLFVVPIVAYLVKIYKPDFRSFWKMPLFVLLEFAIIFFNNAWFSEIGILKMRTELVTKDYVNSAFVYGPYFYRNDEVLGVLDIMVPKFLKTVPEGFTFYDTLRGFYNYGGQTHYWPVVWVIGPLLVYGYPVSFGLYTALDFKGFKEFISKFKKKK